MVIMIREVSKQMMSCQCGGQSLPRSCFSLPVRNMFTSNFLSARLCFRRAYEAQVAGLLTHLVHTFGATVSMCSHRTPLPPTNLSVADGLPITWWSLEPLGTSIFLDGCELFFDSPLALTKGVSPADDDCLVALWMHHPIRN